MAWNQQTRFHKPQEENLYNPPEYRGKFLQLCSYPNPNYGKYDCRIVEFDENYEIIKRGEFILTREQYLKLISECKTNEYKIYHTTDIDYVDIPCIADFLIVQSSLLN